MGYEGRLFLTGYREIGGGRFDPEYQSVYYKQLIKAVLNSNYSLLNLEDVTIIIASGKTPARTEYSDETTSYPIIKVGSYTDDCIDLEKCSYTLKEQSLEINKGDIFILSAAHQAEYVGKHIKYLNVNPKTKISYVGELICIRANANYNSLFLFSLLQTKIYKELINREKTGQTSHIYGKDLKFLKMPNIPIEKQNEIALHISEIRKKAKELQFEATKILEDAKKKIEQMILVLS